MRAIAIVLLAAAGCGAGSDVGTTPGDASDGCAAFITFAPGAPTVGMPVRAMANVSGVSGLPGFNWSVKHHENNAPVTFTPAQADNSAIQFDTPTAGTYDIQLDLTMTSKLCPTAVANVNVLNDNSPGTKYRLRVLATNAPPQEKLIQIPKGLPSYAYGGDDLTAGNAITATVTSGAALVPAYIRITPVPAPDEIVEAYSDASGVFYATVTGDMQTVLVIPASTALAPRVFTTDFSSSQTFDLDAGTAVSGVVTAPSGAGLAGAQVQLTIGGVPSTLVATAADGSFTVQAVAPASATPIAIDVTPPAASGLPRLAASGTLDPTKSFSIAYSPALLVRDLAGTQVMRGGSPVANAQVTLVGTVSNAAQITVNGAMVTATGAIHVSAKTSGTGVLPSLKAPALGMSAVVQVATGDLAVASIDLTGAAPATIVAPGNLHATPEVDDSNNQPLEGVAVDVVPVGALALAGALPSRATSSAAGQVTLSLAAGGSYDFRLHDPQARAAALVRTGIDSTVTISPFLMPPATLVTGDVAINGLGPAANAVVQLLCMTCGGVERMRPIVEVTTDGAGHYHYPVVKLP